MLKMGVVIHTPPFFNSFLPLQTDFKFIIMNRKSIPLKIKALFYILVILVSFYIFHNWASIEKFVGQFFK